MREFSFPNLWGVNIHMKFKVSFLFRSTVEIFPKHHIFGVVYPLVWLLFYSFLRNISTLFFSPFFMQLNFWSDGKLSYRFKISLHQNVSNDCLVGIVAHLPVSHMIHQFSINILKFHTAIANQLYPVLFMVCIVMARSVGCSVIPTACSFRF